MFDIKIIAKDDIPLSGNMKPIPDWLLPILDKLQSLPDETALQITMANVKEAKRLIVCLIYFCNKRHRKSKSNMPLMAYSFSQRQHFVFIYKK